MSSLHVKATQNIKDILSICIKHDTDRESALVIYDNQYVLTDIVLAGYREALPSARFINFDEMNKEEIIDECNQMKPHDLVVLIQSTNFLLNEFRIRLHLFNKNLKVIEHMHLARNAPSMWETYVDALAYDTSFYPVVAPQLKAKLDVCEKLVISSGEVMLEMEGGLEPAMLNIGDYTNMNNIGGTFPIGEVFTEGKDLTGLYGSVYIYAFADKDFNVQMYEPFLIHIEKGEIVGCGDNTPELFKEILTLVKSYERPVIREIGFGLNRAITREHYLSDITAFERIHGMHLSLGEKHSVYKKEGMTTNKTKFHIDIFPVVDRVMADAIVVFEDGKYIV